MPYLRAKEFYCSNCGWTGFEEEAEWSPFNPIDDFYNLDARENPNNVIAFRIHCPNCKQEVQYAIT